MASLGDSRAVLDTGSEIFPLTVDHRLSSHKGERHRLESMGALVAPLDSRGVYTRGLTVWDLTFLGIFNSQ